MGILDTPVGGLWVSEYSAKQKAFHIEIFKEAVALNAGMVAEKQNNDYLIFGVFNTFKEADAACDEMTRIQEKRGE